MSDRTCPGCGGTISRRAQLCRLCRPRAIAAGVNLLAPGARAPAPATPAAQRTPGQSRAYHGKCGTLARLLGEQPQEVKRAALEKASRMFDREITSSSDLNEIEMSDVLDQLDAAIAKATNDG